MARPHSRLAAATVVDPVMEAHHLLLLQLNGSHERSLHHQNRFKLKKNTKKIVKRLERLQMMILFMKTKIHFFLFFGFLLFFYMDGCLLRV
jgi:hypothetical protein